MGGKKITAAIYVEENVIREARKLGLNISRTCENALEEAIKRLKGSSSQNHGSDSPNPRCPSPLPTSSRAQAHIRHSKLFIGSRSKKCFESSR
jgi:hypothetical protein